MSIIVYTENWDGKFKKSTYEALSYASEIAKSSGSHVVAVSIGNVGDEDLKSLGKYGANKVLNATDAKLNTFDAAAYSAVIADAVTKEDGKIVVISNTYTGRAVSGRVAAKLKAGLVAGATQIPSTMTPLTVRKKCFSGKGLTDVEVKTPVAVISITPNSYKVITSEGVANVEAFSSTLPEIKTVSKEIKKTSGKIALTEAELVVSAGRGMKGPENWNLVENLAEALGAATACSKPVADVGWRPHHEHVGQTGITIGPNLYIAIGISGAIQHLAGVSSSKVIVAINSDPEAPFFKAADYGIVGDAFEILPKLTAAVKNFKASHN